MNQTLTSKLPPFSIESITSTIERALRRVPGVLDAYVNPVTELAYVDYDPAVSAQGQSSAQARSRRETDAGYR